MLQRVLFLLCIFCNLHSFSQSARVIRFDVKPTDNDRKALIRWTMNSGSTCLDLTVERSSDNLNFKEVYVFPGVCGSADSAVSYSWVDAAPVPVGTSYYRLKLDAVEFSLVSQLDLSSILKDNDIIAFPNPSTGLVNLEFVNGNRENYSVHLYDQRGVLIFEDFRRNGSFYSLNLPFLERGVYQIVLNFENAVTLQTKIIIR